MKQLHVISSEHRQNDSVPHEDCSLLDACQHVDPPVGLDGPAELLALRDLLKEMLLGLSLVVLFLERLPQVSHVFGIAQLRDARQLHEGEKGDQQARVGAQQEVRLVASVLMQAREDKQNKDILKQITFMHASMVCLCCGK